MEEQNKKHDNSEEHKDNQDKNTQEVEGVVKEEHQNTDKDKTEKVDGEKQHSNTPKEHKTHEHHKKAEHKSHHKKTGMRTTKQNGGFVWKVISGVLFVLFLAAVFTQGFTFDNSSYDTVVAQMEAIKDDINSEEAQAKVESAKNIILEAKQLDQSQESSSEVSGEKVEDENTADDGGSEVTGEAAMSGSTETVDMRFYVMSQCPYGTQVVDAMAPVMEKMGEHINLTIDYIVTESGDNEFKSLHGESEVKGNIVQLCGMEYNPDKYMDFLVCMNKNAGQIPGNWESCAKENDLDVESIRECYEGEEGKELLSASGARAKEANARGSPTIYINDQLYSGQRSETGFMRAACNELDYEADACESIPEPTEVKVIALSDERCGKECDTSSMLGSLKGVFPGIDVENVDYSSDRGQEIYDEYDLGNLPAILMDKSVEEAEGYSNVQRYLQDKGDYYSLAIGAKFDPTKEICDNGKDDTGNGKVDCEDTDCEESMACREEIKKHLQVFTMSDCPYGKEAIKALDEVVDNFDGIEYEVHYIANKQGDGFSSLHGQYEVEEDIRQLCVNEIDEEDVWMDYMVCRSENGVKGKDWKNCANKTGVDIQAVEECTDGEQGKELLEEDIKIAQSLGISASPTWLANNVNKFSGVDAETVKSQFCKSNPELEGCDNTLTTSSTPSGSC